MTMQNIPWATIRTFDGNAPTHTLGRRPEDNEKYRKHLTALEESNVTIDQYIVNSVMLGRDVFLTENQFPYWVEDGITHMLLWMMPGHEMDLEAARAYVCNMAQCSKEDVVLFQNHANNKSVKCVPHYQVFIRSLP